MNQLTEENIYWYTYNYLYWSSLFLCVDLSYVLLSFPFSLKDFLYYFLSKEFSALCFKWSQSLCHTLVELHHRAGGWRVEEEGSSPRLKLHRLPLFLLRFEYHFSDFLSAVSQFVESQKWLFVTMLSSFMLLFKESIYWDPHSTIQKSKATILLLFFNLFHQFLILFFLFFALFWIKCFLKFHFIGFVGLLALNRHCVILGFILYVSNLSHPTFKWYCTASHMS